MRVGRGRETGHTVDLEPRTGPLVIAYDASSASKLAIDEAGNLFPGQPTLVVHVWEAGAAYEAGADPTLLPAPLAVHTAIELDKARTAAVTRATRESSGYEQPLVAPQLGHA